AAHDCARPFRNAQLVGGVRQGDRKRDRAGPRRGDRVGPLSEREMKETARRERALPPPRRCAIVAPMTRIWRTPMHRSALALISLIAAATPAAAQDYPTRPIRV